jgi:hypothetical protein
VNVRPIVALAAPLVIAACGTAPSDTHEAPTSLVRLEEPMTLGCSDCEGPEQFGGVRNVAIDSDGRVFVVARHEPFIRVFERDGRHTFSIGREGDGPGEMKAPWFVFFEEDGSFIVLDSGYAPRISVFSSGGDFIDSYQPTSRQLTNAGYDRTNDVLYMVAGWGAEIRIDRWPLGASAVSTLLANDEAFPRARDGGPSQGFFGFAVTRDGGFVIGDRWHAYRLQLFDADGAPAGETGRPIARTPLTEDELERARAVAERNEERGLGRSEVPTEKPHFDQWSLSYDDAGRLWVRTTRTATSITTFDMFDSDGAYLGEVTLPLRLPRVATSFDVAAGLLAAVVLDELDNPSVKVWRVVHQ